MEQLIPTGILVIIIGFILVITGSVLMALKSKAKAEWAFGGFIGPLPFGWATKEEWLRIIIILSIIFLILFLLINRKIILGV